jgi:porphobilinogen deaminase
MTQEAELIRALAEDLALEILTSYTSSDDFEDADFSSLGKAAVYLEEHAQGPGPALQELIDKIQSAAESAKDAAPEPPPIVGEP